VTQAGEAAFGAEPGPEPDLTTAGGAAEETPDEPVWPVGAEDEPEEGNRALAPISNAVLGHVARSIVDDPDAVEIETIPLRAGKVRLAVRVAPNDFGRLIGRRGRVAAAVRTLVGAAAVRDGLDVEVEFVE
jgi:predicted RNA-binding protein YlqC (UPF0109 family)